MIYCTITNVACVLFLNHPFAIKEMVNSAFFLRNWFVTAFIMFLLTIPIIGDSLKDVNHKELSQWILLLTILNIIFGWFWQKLNTNGYNALNFIYLYYIGRWLRMYSESKLFAIISKNGIWLYLISTALLAILSLMLSEFSTSWTIADTSHIFAYNNPLIILSSIFLFVWFSRLKIHNNLINILASSTLGVFLLHTTTIIRPYRDAFANNVFLQYGYLGAIVLAIMIFSICSIVSLIVEKVKKSINLIKIKKC